MSSTSLAGLRVLITRPAPQQEALIAAIEAAAGATLYRPLLAISALQDAADRRRLRSRLLDLDRFQILIFVSLNAVQHGVASIEDLWPQFPEGIQLVAIGPGTGARLRESLGREVVWSSAGVTTEELLAMPELGAIAGQRIGIVRGRGGRELLAATLRERGAEVEYLEVYERHDVDYVPAEFVHALKANAINVLTVSSGESLQRLVSLLGDNKAEMSLLPLLVPSQRVAQQATAAGFDRVIDCEGADVDACLKALTALAQASG